MQELDIPLGAMFGSRIARDEDGNLLVDGVGNYLADQVDEDGVLPFIGDPNPDFVMNYTNTFEYKGLSLGFAIKSHLRWRYLFNNNCYSYG